MNWNTHSELKEGSHAFLSPSGYHWLNYTEDKLRAVYLNRQAAQMGTRLHEFAAEAIRLKRRQPRGKDTLSMYVNDAISYRMRPEQPLVYSEHCFGTCDAIAFDEHRRILRISDLKTGDVQAQMWQLRIYAALFILEYGARLSIASPHDIGMELRIYQSGEVMMEEANPDEILEIMKTIVESDKVLDKMDLEEAI